MTSITFLQKTSDFTLINIYSSHPNNHATLPLYQLDSRPNLRPRLYPFVHHQHSRP